MTTKTDYLQAIVIRLGGSRHFFKDTILALGDAMLTLLTKESCFSKSILCMLLGVWRFYLYGWLWYVRYSNLYLAVLF